MRWGWDFQSALEFFGKRLLFVVVPRLEDIRWDDSAAKSLLQLARGISGIDKGKEEPGRSELVDVPKRKLWCEWMVEMKTLKAGKDVGRGWRRG